VSALFIIATITTTTSSHLWQGLKEKLCSFRFSSPSTQHEVGGVPRGVHRAKDGLGLLKQLRPRRRTFSDNDNKEDNNYNK